MEGYIAKSPKVESLNTNPEGKIYPVISHGRATEVHLQFAHLARQVFLGAQQESERRLDAVRQDADWQQSQRSEEFHQRRQLLQPGCLLCNKPLVSDDGIAPAGYYAETADGHVAGYLEEDCFSSLVFRHFYHSQREVPATDPLRDLFRDSAQRSYFVLRRAPNTRNFYQQQISFYRFDEEGLEVSNKTVELQEFETRFLSREQTLLYKLAARTLFDAENRIGDSFLLIRRVSTDFPEEILYAEERKRFTTVQERIAGQLP